MSRKKVYITGIGSGIGESLGKLFFKDDYQVCGCVRNTSQAERVTSSNPYYNIDIADLSNLNGTTTVSKTLFSNTFDYLIFCAGYGKIGDFSNITNSQISETFWVNTLSPIIITQNNLSSLSKTKIVYISSVFSQIPFPKAATYSASKSALSHFYKSLRNELPHLKLLCLEIGAVQTPMHIKAGMKKSIGKDIHTTSKKIYTYIHKKQGIRSIYLGWNTQKYLLPLLFYMQYIYNKYLGKNY